MNRRPGAIVALIMAAGAVLGVAAPARAHADLQSSSPGDGAELDAAPSLISFSFREQLIPAGNAITLTATATGSRLDLGEVEVDSNTASVAWPDEARSGQYRAAYRVVSADGHPIAGSITFTIAGPGAQPSASAPSQTQLDWPSHKPRLPPTRTTRQRRAPARRTGSRPPSECCSLGLDSSPGQSAGAVASERHGDRMTVRTL
jgi:methionine-rich copper-binding protein CopC